MSSKLSKDIYENLLQIMYIFYYLISTYFYKKNSHFATTWYGYCFYSQDSFYSRWPFFMVKLPTTSHDFMQKLKCKLKAMVIALPCFSSKTKENISKLGRLFKEICILTRGN